MAEEQQISYLISGYMAKSLTPEEYDLLMDWLAIPGNRDKFIEYMTPHMFDSDDSTQANFAGAELILENIFAADTVDTRRTPAKLKPIFPIWFRYAAAMVILFIGAAIYFYNPNSKSVIPMVVGQPREIAPGREKAVLTLSDGRKIILEANDQETITDGKVSILNKQGTADYTGARASAMINTMRTPRGGQYKLILSDGTIVWLNASSGITFPAAFTGKERSVNIEGEVYFEVAKNASAPFVVNTPKEKITVLGTSFNVNAYPDEPSEKISLVEGSIRIRDKKLKAGDAYRNGTVANTNISHDIAWINNEFVFDGSESIEESMRPIARWYDVKVKFEGKINDHLWGSVQRNLPLSQALKALEKTGEVKFEINGNEVIVKP